MQNIKNRILSHKKISVLILLAIIALGYLGYKLIYPATTTSTYLLGEVKKGTIVSTITGTGQVSALNQLAITPKVSGTVTSIRVKSGDSVNQGQTLFTIDSIDAQKKVRDAELDLQSALANIDYVTKSNDLAVENAYSNLLNSNFEVVSKDDKTDKVARPTVSGNYNSTKEGTITITTYASVDGISVSVKGLVEDTRLINTVNPIPIGDSGLFITFPSNVPTDMNWEISIPNKNASNYNSNKISYEQALRTQADAQKENGVTLLGIQAKRNTLADARQILADYSVKATLSGIVANIPIKVGNQVSTGTTMGTIITKQRIATIPLNEVDIAKVKIGQKVTATFDAIEGLEITGKVISIDSIGTVTSGVVNYNVDISFDTDDDRIKPGMSTNASIATQIAQDVLVVPTSAIKTTNGNSYIQIAPKGQVATTGNTGITLDQTPEQVEVVKGISDDLNTEIISGIAEGDIIVTKTITTASKTTTTSTAPSILGSGGARIGR